MRAHGRPAANTQNPESEKSSRGVNARRRGLLLALGAGGAGAAALAARSLSGVAAGAGEAAEGGASSGSYRLTDHVKRYYRTAKI
jgi:hypothetical protein